MALFLAGCGGGDAKPAAQSVTGSGFRFSAPADWKVKRSPGVTSAAAGEQLVSVTVFPLKRAFRPAQWDKAVPELDRVAQQLADELKGRVESRATTTLDGRRARTYDLAYAHDGKELVERIAFVLEGKREYQLLCRYRADDRDCAAFIASFALL